MSIEFLFIALLAVSVLTNLTVEGIKTVANKNDVNYSSNVLAAITAVIISLLMSGAYIIYNNAAISAKVVVEIIVLAYLSFLVATNGYDKVIQSIKQIQNEIKG